MLASDVVMAVLVHIPNLQLQGSPLQIHAAFRKVAHEHPELFDDFTFGRPGGPVSSYAVEVAWDNLATAGMLSTANPRLVTHTVDEVAVQYFHDRLEDDFVESGFDHDTLAAVANEFLDALTAVTNHPTREDLLVLG